MLLHQKAIIFKTTLWSKAQDFCENEEDMLLHGFQTLVLLEDSSDFLTVLWNKS